MTDDDAWLRALRSHQEALLAAVENAEDARSGITAGVGAYLRWHDGRRDEARILRRPGPPRERPEAWKARAALNRPFFTALLAWWAGHSGAGTLRPLPPVLIHALWLGPARDLCDLWLQGVVPGDPGDYADEIGEAAWRSVSAAG